MSYHSPNPTTVKITEKIQFQLEELEKKLEKISLIKAERNQGRAITANKNNISFLLANYRIIIIYFSRLK